MKRTKIGIKNLLNNANICSSQACFVVWSFIRLSFGWFLVIRYQMELSLLYNVSSARSLICSSLHSFMPFESHNCFYRLGSIRVRHINIHKHFRQMQFIWIYCLHGNFRVLTRIERNAVRINHHWDSVTFWRTIWEM